MLWKKNTNTLYVLSDKYAVRYVEELECRCTAYKFYLGSCTYSDTVAFWYSDYATKEDAVKAAKAWLLRGELEAAPEKDLSFELTHLGYLQPSPELEGRGW